MVEEALKINPVIAVAEQARQILQEDRWDVFGKGIAELSAVACQGNLFIGIRSNSPGKNWLTGAAKPKYLLLFFCNKKSLITSKY